MVGLPNVFRAPAALNLTAQAPIFAPPSRTSGGPLQSQQLGWSRPQTTALPAQSNALENYRPAQSKFVRPDTDEAAGDILAAFVNRSSKPVAINAPPHFRSALEQVSYDTNSSRMRTVEQKSKLGQRLLGHAARIFGK